MMGTDVPIEQYAGRSISLVYCLLDVLLAKLSIAGGSLHIINDICE